MTSFLVLILLLRGGRKKVEGSIKAADLWDSMSSVVKKFNNLIKRKVETEEFDKTKKGFVYFIRNQDLSKTSHVSKESFVLG